VRHATELLTKTNNYQMRIFITFSILVISTNLTIAQQGDNTKKIMDGFPPSRESQVSFQNYREYPYSQWSFRNPGAPLHILMLPRSGSMHQYSTPIKPAAIANTLIKDSTGNSKTFETIFKENYADGIIVLQNNTILYEQYWNGLNKDYQHMWFSMTKSLTSTAFGILVEQKKIDLTASPTQYIPELRNTPYERATIHDVLNMSTALGFKENYTDTSSFFWKYYGTARDGYFVKGARDADPMTTDIYGTYDFLAKSVTPNNNLRPGEVFEYNGSNADVIGWMISRISGQPITDFIRQNIWAKIGAEHDAMMAVDRAYMGVATSAMNTTLRDAALFGTLILNHGKVGGQQIIPSQWVDETLKITEADKIRYSKNDVYIKAGMPWVAYKNFWWILDEKKGEFAAIGIHGQVIYINRAANLVIAYFSSQPVASSAASKNFLPKLNACRELSKKLMK
jgi:CubicO group peptidase (beta-lactamase class C family)